MWVAKQAPHQSEGDPPTDTVSLAVTVFIQALSKKLTQWKAFFSPPTCIFIPERLSGSLHPARAHTHAQIA